MVRMPRQDKAVGHRSIKHLIALSSDSSQNYSRGRRADHVELYSDQAMVSCS